MFTISQMSHEGVDNMLSFIHTNISYVHFTVLHIFLCGIENICTIMQQYFKSLLFRIYPRVGENSMYSLYNQL